MLADAAKAGPPVNFNRQFPGSAEVVLDGQDVAAPFTKPGWAFMRAALKNPEKYFAGEAWVLGSQTGGSVEGSSLAQQLTARYNSDFLKAWRAYLQSAGVLKYASLADAAKKLGVLSGNQSPLLALFWLASQNTAVDAPEVANVFQPVQAVVPPSSVDRYIAPPNQGYMNALVTLQASVESVAGQPQGNDAAAAQTLTNATAAKVAARQVAADLPHRSRFPRGRHRAEADGGPHHQRRGAAAQSGPGGAERKGQGPVHRRTAASSPNTRSIRPPPRRHRSPT